MKRKVAPVLIGGVFGVAITINGVSCNAAPSEGSILLDQSSSEMLDKVHPDLRSVIRSAANDFNREGTRFAVTEGARSATRQAALVAAGLSLTMNSRHIPGKDGWAKAVDLVVIVNGKVTWEWGYYKRLAQVVKDIARAMSIPIEWGGDWKRLKDGPHFQLSRKRYP